MDRRGFFAMLAAGVAAVALPKREPDLPLWTDSQWVRVMPEPVEPQRIVVHVQHSAPTIDLADAVRAAIHDLDRRADWRALVGGAA